MEPVVKLHKKFHNGRRHLVAELANLQSANERSQQVGVGWVSHQSCVAGFAKGTKGAKGKCFNWSHAVAELVRGGFSDPTFP